MVVVKELVESYLGLNPLKEEYSNSLVESNLEALHKLADNAEEYYKNNSLSSLRSTMITLVSKANQILVWTREQGVSESTVSDWERAYKKGHDLGLNDGDVGFEKTDDTLKKLAGEGADDATVEKFIQGYKDGLVDNRNAGKPPVTV